MGLPTDPALIVQRVVSEGTGEKVMDVIEFGDLPSPMKVSSNGYAYDGPPYNAGTSDFLGKLTIPEDGRYRLQLTDLFGGTRKDPRNVYRLVVRKAQPDFALVSWAMHMELRNGDRNALSKPISLRGGATMALEVVAVRRDGFEGDIDLVMEGLPEGVTAQGLKIPSGKSRGLMLVTAAENAPRSLSFARFFGRARIGNAEVTRPCRLATMAWPIPDAWGEIPHPRLLADVPVSVSGFDLAPITISPSKKTVWEAKANDKLTIPLTKTRRSEFSGSSMQMKIMGAGFENSPAFDLSLTTDGSQAVLDLAALKPAPGEYLIAFYGGAVAKYRHHPEQVGLAEQAQKKAEQDVAAVEAEVKKLIEAEKTSSVEKKSESAKALEEAKSRRKKCAGELEVASQRLKNAVKIAQSQDIVDIVVSEPISIRVNPMESK